MTDRHHIDRTTSLAPSSDPERIAKEHQARAQMDHPKQIGPYKVLELLGEGGMGTIYLAEQDNAIHRRVAIKIIKLGMDTKSVIARFEAEREALAVMDHPNVARVFDAGATEQGRPYFAMELVKGIPITEYCDKHRLGTKDRLLLFMDVCHAVQHAHQKGIIHRDIKPSNVLVTIQGNKPTVKVIDFGVAKAMQHRLSSQTVFTEHGQLIGTPGYMSPEQAEMTALDIDTRTDIYSLGVLLYELLVGMRPFDDKILRRAAIGEIQRIIREIDPPKPSTRFSSLLSARRPVGSELYPNGGIEPLEVTETGLKNNRGLDEGRTSVLEIARSRHTEPKMLARMIRGDLDWIVMKCLEKDRMRRYDTANALVMELQRYLNNEPVLAGPPSATYRVKKFVRRNKGPVAAVIVVIVVLVGGLAGTSFGLAQAVRAKEAETEQRRFAEQSERAALAARDEAETVTEFLTETLASVDPEKHGKDVTVREVLDLAAKGIAEKFVDRPLLQARIQFTIGRTYRGLGLYEKAQAHLADAAALYHRTKGERDLLTLGTVNALSAVLSDLGDYRAAEAQQMATLETQRRVLGEEHPDTLLSMNNLAISLDAQGRYSEAEELHRRTLEIKSRVLGDEHPSTLLTMNNLAAGLSDQGRHSEAEALYRRTLEIQKRVQGDEHPHTLASMNNLANCSFRQGHYSKAEALYRRTLEVQERVQGPEHPHTLASMNNLANSLYKQGRYVEAETLRRQTLTILRRVLGKDHPETLTCMHNLANTLHVQGRYKEAEALSRQTSDILSRVLGKDHPLTLASMNSLASSLNEQGHSSEAERLHRQTLNTRRRVLGEDHPETLGSMENLAACLYSQSRYSEAESLHRQTLSARRRVLGEEHPDTLLSMSHLATNLHDQSRYTEAEPLSAGAVTGAVQALPPEHPDLAAYKSTYGQVLLKLQLTAKAEPLLLDSFPVLSAAGGKKKEAVKTAQALVELYEARHAAEPDAGYDLEAAEWRAKLEELPTTEPQSDKGT